MSSLRLRRGLYYLYVLLFLVTAPTVVLYTAGYRFDFRTQSLVKTGALSVTTVPRGAELLLSGDEQLTKTPSLLKNVIPGTYELTLSKEGYHSWQRQIQVNSRETTFVDEVVLFLDSESVGQIVEDGAEAVSASGNGDRYAYVETGGSWYEIWEADPSSLEQTLLDRQALTVESTAEQALRLSIYPALPEYLFSSQEEAVLLQQQTDPLAEPRPLALLPSGTYRAIADAEDGVLIMEEDGPRLFFIDTQTTEAPILLNTRADFFTWDENSLVYGDAFEVHRFDPKSGVDTLITRSGEVLLDARAIGANTYLFVFADRLIAYDISDASHPVTTVLYRSLTLQNFWLSQDKKTAYITSKDSVDGLTILFLPLRD